MILARTVAQTTDVDGMLDSMTPQQFDEWLAMYLIKPWGIEYSQEQEEEKPLSALQQMRQMAGV